MPALHSGCPHRSRFEEGFARENVRIDRVVGAGSFHAILGSAVTDMRPRGRAPRACGGAGRAVWSAPFGRERVFRTAW